MKYTVFTLLLILSLTRTFAHSFETHQFLRGLESQYGTNQENNGKQAARTLVKPPWAGSNCKEDEYNDRDKCNDAVKSDSSPECSWCILEDSRYACREYNVGEERDDDIISCDKDDPCFGVVCTPPDQCHEAGTCDSATGICSSDPTKLDNDTPCDDGSGCTRDDSCLDGVCVGQTTCSSHASCQGQKPDDVCICGTGYEGDGFNCVDIDGCADAPCFPGVVCTDVPAPGTGYVCGPCPPGYDGDGIQCNDIDECLENNGGCPPTSTCTNADGGRWCSAPDQCHFGGYCIGALLTCPTTIFEEKQDDNPCDDDNLCTRTDMCQSGVCVGTNPVACPHPISDQCRDPGTCNPATGQCSAATPKEDGTSCTDWDDCTEPDTCKSGLCIGGPNICTRKYGSGKDGALDLTGNPSSNLPRGVSKTGPADYTLVVDRYEFTYVVIPSGTTVRVINGSPGNVPLKMDVQETVDILGSIVANGSHGMTNRGGLAVAGGGKGGDGTARSGGSFNSNGRPGWGAASSCAGSRDVNQSLGTNGGGGGGNGGAGGTGSVGSCGSCWRAGYGGGFAEGGGVNQVELSTACTPGIDGAGGDRGGEGEGGKSCRSCTNSSGGRGGGARSYQLGDSGATLLTGGCGGSGGSSGGTTGGGGGGGGGAIRIRASGTLTIDGLLLANGGEGGKTDGNNNNGSGGGGSGGTIYLVAPEISASGQVWAKGGHGGDPVHQQDASGGGGGAGRVLIYSTDIANLLEIGFSPKPSIIESYVQPT